MVYLLQGIGIRGNALLFLNMLSIYSIYKTILTHTHAHIFEYKIF